MGEEKALFDVEFIRYLIQQSIGVGFAAFIFVFYRRDMKESAERWKSQADRESAQTAALMLLVKENTVATTTNTEVLRALHRRVDDLDLLKVVDQGHVDGGRRQGDEPRGR
jgi:hypothetical protein